LRPPPPAPLLLLLTLAALNTLLVSAGVSLPKLNIEESLLEILYAMHSHSLPVWSVRMFAIPPRLTLITW
jgi:hypothetical protein